ncbi:glycosyltransferase family protein [Pseudovibrio exalbescens]|uniref:Spore protein YkvP/CgeB glycosyl transferase-like domain-containing protein n=1 Tax=Pseudovibrio exalbescens TaxID=197461 RepID=A0A1U7JJ97_9HYPH|nr:glycosyltransferase [Pseudovibrio exalbescens]OKL44775.1 hypothetical protein A3843_06760 [Pseudovibrio exalbescens]
MRVLALTANYDGWIADTIYREQVALREALRKEGGELHFYGPGFRYNSNYVPQIIKEFSDEGITFDALICYSSPLDLLKNGVIDLAVADRYSVPAQLRSFPRGLDRVTCVPKIFWMNDYWQISAKRWDEILLGNGFSTVLSVYTPFHTSSQEHEATFSSRLRQKVKFIHSPRALDPDYFSGNLDRERDIDVTLLGAISSETYPSRFYFSETLKRQSGLSKFLKDHPGYNFNQILTGGVTGDAYREVLTRTKLFVTCGTKRHLPLIKVYEAMASGCVLCIDGINGAAELHMEEGKHFKIITTCNFMAEISKLLRDEEKRQEIAFNAFDLFRNKHTTGVRAEQTLQSIRDSVIEFQNSAKPNRLHYLADLYSSKVASELKNLRSKLAKGNLVGREEANSKQEEGKRKYSALDCKNIVAFSHFNEWDVQADDNQRNFLDNLIASLERSCSLKASLLSEAELGTGAKPSSDEQLFVIDNVDDEHVALEERVSLYLSESNQFGHLVSFSPNAHKVLILSLDPVLLEKLPPLSAKISWT